jgi:hypothetical protein
VLDEDDADDVEAEASFFVSAFASPFPSEDADDPFDEESSFFAPPDDE